jgi:hypothetical protein
MESRLEYHQNRFNSAILYEIVNDQHTTNPVAFGL